MKAIKQYFSVVLLIMLCKVALDEIRKCDHSNESYLAVLFIMLCKVALTIECVTIPMKDTEKYFPVVLVIILHNTAITIES